MAGLYERTNSVKQLIQTQYESFSLYPLSKIFIANKVMAILHKDFSGSQQTLFLNSPIIAANCKKALIEAFCDILGLILLGSLDKNETVA